LGGLDQFNEAVADYYLRRSNVVLDSQSEILQTMGSQEGLVHLPFAFCDEGDIVLTTNPAYVAYDTGIKLDGDVPYNVTLQVENKAKVLIIYLTGKTIPDNTSMNFFNKVVEFPKKQNIFVVLDDVY